MKGIKRLATSILLMLALNNGVSGVHVTASGGESGEKGSTSINIQAADSAEVISNIMVDGADISPKTKINYILALDTAYGEPLK